jgi:hypothetical protein
MDGTAAATQSAAAAAATAAMSDSARVPVVAGLGRPERQARQAGEGR